MLTAALTTSKNSILVYQQALSYTARGDGLNTTSCHLQAGQWYHPSPSPRSGKFCKIADMALTNLRFSRVLIRFFGLDFYIRKSDREDLI